MRLLILTTLFPNEAMPNHGIFVENRLNAVRTYKECDIKVIAPVPWFPSRARIFGEYAKFARVPRYETRHGLDIRHPRYVIAPKISMSYAVNAMYRCVTQEIDLLREKGWDFDLIDAHYFYPDGVVASKIAKATNKPLVITARGSDISLLPDFPRQKAQIIHAAQTATHNIAVCNDLKDKMINLGVADHKISVFRNGVDLQTFHQMDRGPIRAKLNLKGSVLVCVGHLIDRKGHDLVLNAFKNTDATTLLIVGTGPKERALKSLTHQLGLEERVRFLGAIPHSELPEIYSAADILVLGSTREGWPNVLLEAMACGTPVIAPPIGGCEEIVCAPEAGLIAATRTPADFTAAITHLRDTPPSRNATRRYAERHGWDETAKGVWHVFNQALNAAAPPSTSPPTHFVPITWPTKTPLKLLVTVDTEEVFDWTNDRFLENHVPPAHDLNDFHEMCTAAHVTPLHFITLPLMEDPHYKAHCKKLFLEGKADFGLQMHHWVVPPIEEALTPFQSYQCNLPPALHQEKLAYLKKAFTALFGVPPLSHRAGRYGISQSVFADLIEQGIRYDFSGASCFDLSQDGGPDYSALNSYPLVRHHNGERFFTIPVSAGRTIRKLERFLPQSKARAGRFHPLPTIVKATTSAARLSPEDRKFSEMKNLTTRLRNDNVGLITLSFHSTSLTPGSTPYCATQDDVTALLNKMFDYLSWFSKKGGDIVTFSDVTELLEQSEN